MAKRCHDATAPRHANNGAACSMARRHTRARMRSHVSVTRARKHWSNLELEARATERRIMPFCHACRSAVALHVPNAATTLERVWPIIANRHILQVNAAWDGEPGRVVRSDPEHLVSAKSLERNNS